MIDWRQYKVWSQTRVHRLRVERARKVIAKAAEHGRVLVSTSWGKDSVALCDIAVDVLGTNVALVHMASPYELPGNAAIVEHFVRRGVTAHTIPPAKTLARYVAWLQSIGGLGYERERAHQAAPRAKRDTMAEWGRDHGYEVQLLGLRADEAVHRKGLLLGRGQVYQRKTDRWWVGHPLGWWTVDDVWAYHVARGLPHHPLYECESHGQTHRTIRNSGWLTTVDAGEGRIGWLRKHWPEQYRQLAEEFPQIRRLVT